MKPFRRDLIILATVLGVLPALAETQTLTYNTRFCPSWAEAHERSLASLNNGRPPFPVKWKGCIVLKQGTSVEIVDHQDWSTEIVFHGTSDRLRYPIRFGLLRLPDPFPPQFHSYVLIPTQRSARRGLASQSRQAHLAETSFPHESHIRSPGLHAVPIQ
jgi:hypothetical protein